jgi:hypothetical protein
MTAGMSTISILDPERCWREWMSLGSLPKVRNLLDKEGLKNRYTQRVPTISAIEKAAFRWMLENLEESRKGLEYAWSREGAILTDEKWNEFVVSAAKLAYFCQPRKLERFLEKHSLVCS